METETTTTARMDGGVPVGTDGALLLQRTLETVTRPCPHCEVRTVTHRVGAVEVTEVLCKPCLRDLRKPDRTDTLCDCRLPDCGQCTELADKGGARMPRYPR